MLVNMPLKCVIHYNSLVPEKEQLTPLNETTFKALLDNKSAQERLGVLLMHIHRNVTAYHLC